MWGFSATFAFCIKAHGLAIFFSAPKKCIFPGASFEPIKIWQLRALKSYKVFMEQLYTIVSFFLGFRKPNLGALVTLVAGFGPL